MNEPLEADAPPVTELTKGQRRVLGTLLEKAFTTPEVYPLTVKALVAGCNQKSNRSPMTDFSEDDVVDVLGELRQLGLVAVVHTETGRTERFRHYMRKRFTFTEPQLAVVTELLLRGRQSVGELRARASRMAPIESLDELREALRGLIEQKYVQASGPLERRGVEVDHGFYPPTENKKLAWNGATQDEADAEHFAAPRATSAASTPRPHAPIAGGAGASGSGGADPRHLQDAIQTLRDENRDLRGRVESLEEDVRRLAGVVDELVRDLRG